METIKTVLAVCGFMVVVILVALAISLPICAKQARVYNEMTGANITTMQMFWIGGQIVAEPNPK